jgi:hypothetical protein
VKHIYSTGIIYDRHFQNIFKIQATGELTPPIKKISKEKEFEEAKSCNLFIDRLSKSQIANRKSQIAIQIANRKSQSKSQIANRNQNRKPRAKYELCWTEP